MRRRLRFFMFGVMATVLLGAWGIPARAAGAANDNFADASPASPPLTASADTSSATVQSGEPQPSCASAGHTVWYAIPSQESGRLEIKTFGSKYDTVVAIYSGSTLGALNELGCNDDDESVGSNQSRLVVAAAAQETFVQVGGFGDAAGLLKISITFTPAPANDDFGFAQSLNDLTRTHETDTTNATLQSGEPTDCMGSGSGTGATVWYSYTAPADSALMVSTEGSSFDTVLAVYSGSTLSTLTQLTCNDDSGGFTSKVGFRLVAGNKYLIQAGGFAGGTGDLQLMASEFVPPTNDQFATPTVIASAPYKDTGTFLGAGLEEGEPMECSYGWQSVWYRFTAPSDRPLPLVANAIFPGSEFNDGPDVAVYSGSSLESLALESCGWTHASFVALPGTTYYIQLVSWGDDQPYNFSLALGAEDGVDALVAGGGAGAQYDGDSVTVEAGAGSIVTWNYVRVRHSADPAGGGDVTACADVVLIGACTTSGTP